MSQDVYFEEQGGSDISRAPNGSGYQKMWSKKLKLLVTVAVGAIIVAWAFNSIMPHAASRTATPAEEQQFLQMYGGTKAAPARADAAMFKNR